jgi:hypothetical protein
MTADDGMTRHSECGTCRFYQLDEVNLQGYCEVHLVPIEQHSQVCESYVETYPHKSAQYQIEPEGW